MTRRSQNQETKISVTNIRLINGLNVQMINYTGNKGEKKKSKEKSGENKNKTSNGEKSLHKSKKNEPYTTEQKTDQASSLKRC